LVRTASTLLTFKQEFIYLVFRMEICNTLASWLCA